MSISNSYLLNRWKKPVEVLTFMQYFENKQREPTFAELDQSITQAEIQK